MKLQRRQTHTDTRTQRERDRRKEIVVCDEPGGVVASDFKDACAWESVDLIKPPPTL
jgi:hypothetical protein